MIRRISLISLIGLIGLTASFAHAQSTKPAIAPTLLLTWQAHSYVPTDYQGKILPPRDSVVDVHLTALAAGHILNLATTSIEWAVNDAHIGGGVGKDTVQVTLNQFTTRTYNVTATLKDYNGSDVSKTISITRANPLVVIDAPYPNNILATPAINAQATPYFFRIADPSEAIFSWQINGLPLPSTLQTLAASLTQIDPGQSVSVTSVAANVDNPVESAQTTEQFTLRP